MLHFHVLSVTIALRAIPTRSRVQLAFIVQAHQSVPPRYARAEHFAPDSHRHPQTVVKETTAPTRQENSYHVHRERYVHRLALGRASTRRVRVVITAQANQRRLFLVSLGSCVILPCHLRAPVQSAITVLIRLDAIRHHANAATTAHLDRLHRYHAKPGNIVRPAHLPPRTVRVGRAAKIPKLASHQIVPAALTVMGWDFLKSVRPGLTVLVVQGRQFPHLAAQDRIVRKREYARPSLAIAATIAQTTE